MVNLAQLTDSYQQEPDVTIGGNGVPTRITVRPEPKPALDEFNTNVGSRIDDILNKLTGANGQERYQLWPEKVIRGGLTAAGDVMAGDVPQWAVDKDTGEVHTSPQMIEKAQEISALAGTGGLAGGADATLGSAPFLRPALKYKDKIYKGKEGQQHQDVIPKELYPEFEQMAMNGEDISHYNFGFMNHKGQFLDREKALEYAINEGLVDAHAGQYGALTSTLMADSSKPGTAIEAMKSNPFYSAVERNVKAIPQDKMTGEQWLGTLSNKPGVKPEELQWTGLSEFLNENKGKPVTKEQIQEHLANNKVELKEVSKGESGFTKNEKDRYDELNKLESTRALTNAELKEAEVLHQKAKQIEAPTKYHSYQLPGGENYREMLLTLPKSEQGLVAKSEGAKGAWNVYDKLGNKIAENLNPSMSEKEALAFSTRHNNEQYKSSHWDEPNVLAHVRMNDRTIDGKKSLHLEEIQSDWHQQGRDKGYKETPLPVRNFKTWLAEEKGITDPKEMKRLWEDRSSSKGIALHNAHLAETEARAGMNIGKVPDAPFKKSWHELALKRMIREAAEKGMDRLSWTPGEAQAARYNLSKTADEIGATKNPDGSYHIEVMLKGGGVHPVSNIKPDKLADIVGKGLADKILKQEGKAEIYDGDNLKIGGEGMKGFYDQIIPKTLEKLGKEHGIKVQAGNLPHERMSVQPGYKEKSWDVVGSDGTRIKKFDTKAEAEKYVKERGSKIHYIDLPQSLKDQAMRGFPLFSSGVPIDLLDSKK